MRWEWDSAINCLTNWTFKAISKQASFWAKMHTNVQPRPQSVKQMKFRKLQTFLFVLIWLQCSSASKKLLTTEDGLIFCSRALLHRKRILSPPTGEVSLWYKLDFTTYIYICIYCIFKGSLLKRFCIKLSVSSTYTHTHTHTRPSTFIRICIKVLQTGLFRCHPS